MTASATSAIGSRQIGPKQRARKFAEVDERERDQPGDEREGARPVVVHGNSNAISATKRAGVR